MKIVYWSSRSENTHRFVEKLKNENIRLPINGTTSITIVDPYILILPSYGDTKETAIPSVVKNFLSNEVNRNNLIGVIGGGNTDFGAKFCYAAKAVSYFYNVKLLHMFELSGTTTDVDIVQNIIQIESRKLK